MLLGTHPAYEDFDDPRMLDFVPPFVELSRASLQPSRGIDIKPLHVPPTVERSDILIHSQGEAPKEGKRPGECRPI